MEGRKSHSIVLSGTHLDVVFDGEPFATYWQPHTDQKSDPGPRIPLTPNWPRSEPMLVSPDDPAAEQTAARWLELHMHGGGAHMVNTGMPPLRHALTGVRCSSIGVSRAVWGEEQHLLNTESKVMWFRSDDGTVFARVCLVASRYIRAGSWLRYKYDKAYRNY